MKCINGSVCKGKRCGRGFYKPHSGTCQVYEYLGRLLYEKDSEFTKMGILKFIEGLVNDKG